MGKTKMFTFNGERMVTWNLFTGCLYQCSYCWARSLTETRLKNTPKYRDGFLPTIWPHEFNRHFKAYDFVFVSSMGDIAFAPSCVFEQIDKAAVNYPQTKFLLCTKNPQIYKGWKFPPNVYFGTTIETNRDTPIDERWHISRAPAPFYRYAAMVAKMRQVAKDG